MNHAPPEAERSSLENRLGSRPQGDRIPHPLPLKALKTLRFQGFSLFHDFDFTHYLQS